MNDTRVSIAGIGRMGSAMASVLRRARLSDWVTVLKAW